MSDHLPQAILDELAEAKRVSRRRKARRSVHVGGQAFPILEMGEKGLAVDLHDAPRLRGLIDIYDGPRHLYQALIVAASEDGDMMRYEFKRNTAAQPSAARDFEAVPTDVVGYLPRD